MLVARQTFPVFLMIAVVGAGLALPVWSQETKLIPPDPWQIIHIAREHGSAEVQRDAMNDPQIVVKPREGPDYRVSFYGCWLGRDCEMILFQTSFTKEDWKLDRDQLSEWNAEKLVGRASLGDGEEAVLDHPVAMQAGLPDETLRKTFEVWQAAVLEFSEHIDF